jgi:hypothetical protein
MDLHRSLTAVVLVVLVPLLSGCGGGSTGSSGNPSSSGSSTGTAPSSSAAGSNTSATASGSIVLTGPVTATLAEGPESSFPVPCGASGTGLQGQVIFGSGSDQYLLAFVAPAGSYQLPLNHGPSLTVSTVSGSPLWNIYPPAIGTFTLSGTDAGSIHGTVDATLAPQQGASAALRVTGSWSC